MGKNPNCSTKFERMQLVSALDFLEKTDRKASDATEFGKFKFFTSSISQKKFCDNYDYDDECIIFGTGGIANIHYVNGKFSTTSHCLVAKVKDENKILMKYVYYFFKKNIKTLEAGFHGVGLKNINTNYIKNLEIEIPSLEIQQKSVETLELAELLRLNRKNADELTKAFLMNAFYYYFGDPYTNSKKWNTDILDNVCDEIHRYPSFYGFDYVPYGVPVLKISYMDDNGGFFKDLSIYDKIPESINQKFPRTIVKEGDIIFEARGTFIGKCAIVTKDLSGANISPNTIRISPNRPKLLPEFLLYLSFTNGWKKNIESKINYWKGGFGTIKMSDLKEIKVILPPLTVQQQFARVVQEVERIHEQQVASGKEIEGLCEELMARAFAGELGA